MEQKPSLRERLREKYYINPLDLANAGESNRLILLISNHILFAFGSIDLLVLLILHYSDLKNYIISITYFCIYVLMSIFVYCYSYKVKDSPREKAYIKKTIPVYILIIILQFAALYNFYILKQPFNGFITYCLTGFISLCLFTLSPFPFLGILIFPIALMAPAIFKNFGLSGLADAILCPVIMYCLALYKRRSEKKQILFLKKQKQNLEAKTFGNFTLIYENKVIKFSRTKSNELMGYLVYKRGSSVNTKELISVLWGDRADSARYGSSFRNLIVDIKHSLADLEIQNFFIAEYNNFRINPEVIKCDYYDFLAGDSTAINSYAGEFMSQFSWAEEIAGFLEMKALKK